MPVRLDACLQSGLIPSFTKWLKNAMRCAHGTSEPKTIVTSIQVPCVLHGNRRVHEFCGRPAPPRKQPTYLHRASMFFSRPLSASSVVPMCETNRFRDDLSKISHISPCLTTAWLRERRACFSAILPAKILTWQFDIPLAMPTM